MEGMVRATYWLGWVFFAIAVIARILLLTSVKDSMVAMSVLPRNFIQLSFLFFVAAIASYVCGKVSKY
ncbi:MAG TPA: hypothetical protein VMS96_10080 [Terriglobales bacterium]|nr:hypothetical protein [Terriglobales bacterium]